MPKTSTTKTVAASRRRSATGSGGSTTPKVSATKAEVVEILLETQKKLLEAETALGTRTRTIAALEDELAAARAEADRAETDAYAAQVEIRILEGARDAAHARLAEARTEVLELTRVLARMQEYRDRDAARIAELSDRLTKAEGSGNSHLEMLQQELATARAKAGNLPDLEQTVARQTQQLATQAQEIVELSRLLSEAEARADDSDRAVHAAGTWLAPLLGPLLSHPSGAPFSEEEYTEYAARIVASGAFDPDWYNMTNPDVAESGSDPARHFLQYGLAEGRAPRDLRVPHQPPEAE